MAEWTVFHDLLFICLVQTITIKSETVYKLFESAIRDYGIPDRVRSDKGGENIKVYYY